MGTLQLHFIILVSWNLVLSTVGTQPRSQNCDTGWFGTGCVYKCRCQYGCNKDGTCKYNDPCQERWFGPACQYADLAYRVSSTSPVKEITDGRDDTCITSATTNTVTITLDNTYPFTWLRVHVSASGKGYLQDVMVTFQANETTSETIDCLNRQAAIVDDRTMDIRCDLDVNIKSVTLTGNAVYSLCSVYISGADLAYKVSSSPVTEITDGKEDTCITSTRTNTVTITLNDSYPFTWLRVHLSDSGTGYLQDVMVTFQANETTSETIDCLNRQAAIVDDRTMDIHCDVNVNIKSVTLTGNAVYSLCSVYISGGRNVALRQATQQAGTYTEVGVNASSDKAVDGNRDRNFKANSCTHTSGAFPAFWSVALSKPQNVNRYVLYNRDGNEDRLRGFILQSYDSHRLEVFSFTDVGLSALDVYTVTSPGVKSPVTSVSIRARKGGENIVTLCEAEIYGDSSCPPLKYGRECDKTCNCAGNVSCFVSTGGCPSGCAVGFFGENCSRVCDSGKYGRQCSQACSQNCQPATKSPNTSCHHVDGKCVLGCRDGYIPPQCTEACEPGKYGRNCSSNCSDNCLSDSSGVRSCDNVNGRCQCEDGYWDLKCDKVCGSGKYGKGCNERCSPNCQTVTSPPYSTLCHHVDGRCLFGCRDGYMSPLCTQGCEQGKFGPNCSLTCSNNCLPDSSGVRSCDNVYGRCQLGCEDGYYWGWKCDLECRRGHYGRNCTRTCSQNCQPATSSSTTSCHHVDGTCPQGCKTGYMPPNCAEACESRRYGLNCTSVCNVHCLWHENRRRYCDKKDGHCLAGCQDGYKGKQCESPCETGQYGPMCNSTCSKNCEQEFRCNHTDGSCFNGCQNGYLLPKCTKTCEVGKFGKNCETNCSLNCLQANNTGKNFCDISNGTCLNGCIHGFTGSGCETAIATFRAENDGHSGRNQDDVVAGVVSGVVVVLVVAAVIGAIMFWRRRQFGKSQQDSGTLSSSGDKINMTGSESFVLPVERNTAQATVDPKPMVTAGNHDNRTISHQDDGGVYCNTVITTSSYVISLNDLPRFLKSKDRNFFQEQFNSIPSNNMATTEVGLSPENRHKNRYKNVPAYDHSRVHLIPSTEKKHGDYINASYVEGYKKEEMFIACQGPTKVILEDFVRMLWEQQVEKVVMLTNLIEDGKQKCERYWPEDGEMKVGEITVKLTTTQVFADYTIRRLQLRKETQAIQNVTHFHFTSWPDKDVPTAQWGLVDFEQRVASYVSNKPTVVHCSAGIGRTGTFIALRNVMREAEDTGQMNFFATVQKLRHDRINMIQTLDQYIFLHQAAQVAMLCIGTTVTLNDAQVRINLLETRSKSGTTKMEEEFKSVCSACSDCTVEATKEENPQNVYMNSENVANRLKNRDNSILPKDLYRVRLATEDSNVAGYINAVLVPSFHKQNQNILTQLPLPTTVVDFWKMVTEYKVRLVVSFEADMKAVDKTIASYLPADVAESAKFSMFTVRTEAPTVSTLWRQQNLVVSIDPEALKKLPNLTDAQKEVRVNHVTCTTADLDPSHLLSTTEYVRSQNSAGEGRTLYMCRDGATYSGLVCVLSLLLDRMDNDHQLTVPLVVGAVKTIRPQVIPTLDQYRLMYQVLQLYSESLNEYSNFSNAAK